MPPTPPPLPPPTADRLFAWLGVFGSPTVLLFCLVLGINLPQLVGLLSWPRFIGGFRYLVSRCPAGPATPTTTAPA